MGYGVKFPAHQLGGSKKSWDFGVYGLPRVWVKTVSTVISMGHCTYYEHCKHDIAVTEKKIGAEGSAGVPYRATCEIAASGKRTSFVLLEGIRRIRGEHGRARGHTK
jgi:hypothetical protein